MVFIFWNTSEKLRTFSKHEIFGFNYIYIFFFVKTIVNINITVIQNQLDFPSAGLAFFGPLLPLILS